VSTEYLTNYVESEGLAAVIPAPELGLDFINFSVVPKSVSVDFYEPKNQYYCNYSVDVSLRKGETVILQYAKDFPFYFSPEDDPAVRANGIALQDSFPVIEGSYRLAILVRNSVRKEFSVFEKNVTVPAAEPEPISEILLGYNLEDIRGELQAPFKSLGKRLLIDPKNTFVLDDTIVISFNLRGLSKEVWGRGEAQIVVRGMKEIGPSEKRISLKLGDYPFHEIIPITCSLSASELSPDYYELKLSVEDDEGKVIAARSANFIVSPQKEVSRPIAISKTFPLTNAYLYTYMIADQYDKAGMTEKAEAFFEKGYGMAPDYKEGLVYYSQFLLKNKKTDRALELVEKLQGIDKFRFDYLLIKGIASTQTGRCEEAITFLLEANKIYNSDTNLLNALGYCFYKTGEKEQALQALGASLRLNPKQEDIRKLIDEIKK
jgi:hypothetical protein